MILSFWRENPRRTAHGGDDDEADKDAVPVGHFERSELDPVQISLLSFASVSLRQIQSRLVACCEKRGPVIGKGRES